MKEVNPSTPTRSPRIENDTALDSGEEERQDAGAYVPTQEERTAFKKALVPVHQKMEIRIGKETIQDVYKETGFDPAKL